MRFDSVYRDRCDPFGERPIRNTVTRPRVEAAVRARARVRAPALRGRRWLGTGGRDVGAVQLRGRVVLLDFWTAGCVNCLRVLDELAALEERFGDALVVLGVHSPKFAHEARPEAVTAAVGRYGVRHPVLDDGPERGFQDSAEPLRFPAKVAPLPGGTLLVSDPGHHRLVELDPDLRTVRRTIGDGHRGWVDGPAGHTRFAEPLGVAVLPAPVAAAVGYDVVVADAANHLLRGVHRDGATVSTIAGTGAQLRERLPVGTVAAARELPLSTPWDVVWWRGRVVVAMAGCHQLWAFDPVTGTVAVLAGTGDEGLRDGRADEAFLAQPSGLAVGPDGTLWVAEAESSALRALPAHAGAGAAVTTAVGRGLFEFGHRDGPALPPPGSGAEPALLQHPLGVAVLPDGSVAVADTYNGAVRRYDPVTRRVETLADGLREPADVRCDGDALLVVESAAHRLVRLPLPGRIVGGRPAGPRRLTAVVAPGPLTREVRFTPPVGQHLDRRFGEPTALTVGAPEGVLASGTGPGPGLVRTLDVRAGGTVRVEAVAATCDGPGVFAACHRYRDEWVVDLRVAAGAPHALVLDLSPPG